MEFVFKRVKNGILVRVRSGVDEGEELVFEERYGSDEGAEVEAFADFLRLIDEYYGPSTSRYSAKRIYVRVGPGDKNADLDRGSGDPE